MAPKYSMGLFYGCTDLYVLYFYFVNPLSEHVGFVVSENLVL